MEGEGGLVFGVCEFGRGHGGRCYGVGAEVCGAAGAMADALYGSGEFDCEWVGYVEVSDGSRCVGMLRPMLIVW